MSFDPIAIVGQACVLPSALSPSELWTLVLARRSVLGRASGERWRVAPERMSRTTAQSSDDGTSSDVGGYVVGFERSFEPEGFALPAAEVQSLDPLFQWLLHVGREALRAACFSGDRSRVGLAVGNLSYPCASLSRFAERVWLSAQPAHLLEPDWPERLGLAAVDPRNRFMSGLPAHLLARALGLGGTAFALDAACASSLYAIKFACDALQDGRADLMLAGAVSCADDLFIHVGFSALGALSPSGQSRPFDASADGLVPAEGAVCFALRRLSDATRSGETILGVIRGIGLSNDGRGRGLLVPSQAGQVNALRAAYAASGLEPSAVSLLECHATGTRVGDATELRTVAEVFSGRSAALPIGSLKANLGHLITAAGGAALIKVLGAFRAGVLPPAPAVAQPAPELSDAPVRLLGEAEPWPTAQPRLAAINAFGFGGNNAHLIVEEPPSAPSPSVRNRPHPASAQARPTSGAVPIVVVGIGARVGNGTSSADFAEQLYTGRIAAGQGQHQAQEISLPLRGLRFPPNDLKQALPQQLLLFAAALEAVASAAPLPNARTGVYVGMQCDAEIARHGARWRLAQWAADLGASPRWMAEARDGVVPLLGAAGVIGAMPNIVANRVSHQLDLGGPSLTLSAEELSGIRALELASRGLASGEIDAALVGAVDLCAEPVHEAARAMLAYRPNVAAADAAVVLVLKRAADAERDGDTVLAVLRNDAPNSSGEALLRLGDSAADDQADADLSLLFGHAHAAWGLVNVAAAVLCCAHRALPHDSGSGLLRPWVSSVRRSARVSIVALGGQRGSVWLDAPAFGASALAEPSRHLQALRASRPPPEPPVCRFDAHWPKPQLPPFDRAQEQLRVLPSGSDAPVLVRLQRMAPPPAWLPSEDPKHPSARDSAPQSLLAGVVSRHVAQRGQVAAVHSDYLYTQLRLERQFLQGQERAMHALSQIGAVPELAEVEPLLSEPSPAAPLLAARAPLAFTRAELELHASGRISELFGPRFKAQDAYSLQVRMPEPPLLLADRVVALDAEPASMGLGSVSTETDVLPDSWYLNDGTMPAGILIEAGQADLFLISYLGVDLLNRGSRVYRLLGCELTYHGSLPRAGDTLHYHIDIDGHAEQGDVRLLFFHYDCTLQGRPALSVRQGQAGFFSAEDLERSGGVLWTPEAQEIQPDARVDAGLVQPPRDYSLERVRAFSEGKLHACFGHGYELGLTHTRTPRIQGGPMLLLGRIEELNPKGGPWGRGYLKSIQAIHSDAWFFAGHFKNDPCMPGTLMFEGCLQAMAFYLAALGHTLSKDGWRFEPVPEEPYVLQCRGQVLPTSSELVCELFVEEVHSGPYPLLYADLLGTVDGLKAFHARRVGLRLVPDWPLSSPECQLQAGLDGGSANLGAEQAALTVGGFRFDYASLVACAWGKPSAAFGPMYAVFDGLRRVARLPGPPYHFMSRVAHIDGELGVGEPGAAIVIEYDAPPTAWYFEHNGYPTMPFCVLLEAVLQACGWLASYVGSALLSRADLSFRNLDGTGTFFAEVLPSQGPIRTTTKLETMSHSGGMILQTFEVSCSVGDTLVYRLDTGFGSFPQSALEQQIGLPTSSEQLALLDAPSNLHVDLTGRPERYCRGSLRLADGMLLMLDSVTAFDARGGQKGLGSLRGEKAVRAEEWFFKAHFFQDPVQPGSLGLEAMLQLLQFYMLHADLGAPFVRPRFQPIALGRPMTWKYRGQVVPQNRAITITLEITEIGSGLSEVYASADASLWVDRKRIYLATGLGMRIVESAETSSGRPPASKHSVPAALDALPPGGPLRLTANEWLPRVIDFWQGWGGSSATVVQQLYSTLIERFVGCVEIEDVDALRLACRRPVLFLGNHQVAIESAVFAILASAFVGKPITTLAKIENREHWLELLLQHTLSYPGHRRVTTTKYFDRNAPDTLPGILRELAGEMSRDGRSSMIHIEGTRALSCRAQVSKMSGTFIDLAIELGSAIVPVRFTGGLPVEPLAERSEFPVNMGRQDIYLGRPIRPEELRSLGYRERSGRVLGAINGLGPASELERPHAPDPELEAAVYAWMERTGASLGHATMYRLIERLEHPCSALASILRGAREGELQVQATPEGRWLLELARRLYGPRGPRARETPA